MINNRPARLSISAITLSAFALVGIVMKEGYTDTAVIPVKGDVPTVGFGSTVKEDGSRVQMGDTITPQAALKRTLTHIGKDEAVIKRCVTAPLSQTEYDLMVDFSYQYGANTLCNSSMVRYANQGNYTKSCESYKLYKKAGGYDCSTTINGKPNTRCWGVWERSLDRYNKCMEAQ